MRGQVGIWIQESGATPLPHLVLLHNIPKQLVSPAFPSYNKARKDRIVPLFIKWGTKLRTVKHLTKEYSWLDEVTQLDS